MWTMVHITTSVLSFSVIFVMAQLILCKRLQSAEQNGLKTAATWCLGMLGVMVMAWLYAVEIFDLLHPGVQVPIHIRVVYTYLFSGSSIAALGIWLKSERSSKS
jgi:hypothetical protein